MSNIAPFPIHEYQARPHRVAQGDRVRVGIKDVENREGMVVEHVRGGKALTPKGAALLQAFERRAS